MTLPYVLPNFNVTANIWRASSSTSDPPDVVSDAQLYLTSRVWVASSILAPGDAVPTVVLRVPKGTDLQAGDTIECDAGDGHFYSCIWTERMHLGFANEYFIGLLEQFGTPPPPPGSIITETGDAVITETGDLMVIE